MCQTEEQIGDKLQFDGASEEREESIDGEKYNDEHGFTVLTPTVI